MNVRNAIKERRSVRTYDKRPLANEDLDALKAALSAAENPFGLAIDFRFLEEMKSPVIVGSHLFVAGKMKIDPHHNEAYGYSFEKFILEAQALGVGTVWIGGTMDRGEFESKMEVGEGEIMPCVSPIGYPAKDMSIREKMMRAGVKAESRLDFEKIVFSGDFQHPMMPDDAKELSPVLEAVRLAPSAVNKQPWRLLVRDRAVHFYLKRSNGFGHGVLDMQKVDLGIALCHFDLTAKELGMNPIFEMADPGDVGASDMEYIASYRI